MEILLISLVIILVNTSITAIIIEYFLDLTIEAFKAEDEYDLFIKNHICEIYDIISHNGLTRPSKKKEESEVK